MKEVNSQAFQIGAPGLPPPFSRLSLNIDDEVPDARRKLTWQPTEPDTAALEPIMSSSALLENQRLEEAPSALGANSRLLQA